MRKSQRDFNVLLRRRRAVTPPLAPSNIVAPVASGDAQVNENASATDGTWVGYPTPVLTHQWYSNNTNDYTTPTAITGETGATYLFEAADEGLYFFRDTTGTNASGSDTEHSNILGPVTAADAISPTVLTQITPAGTAPVEFEVDSPDYVAGFYGQLQLTDDITFATVDQDRVVFIDGESWALNQQTYGYSSPAGGTPWYARHRILQDNESGAVTVTDNLGNTFNADASAWSNVVTDTISGSAATWESTNGVNKSQYLTISSPFLTVLVNANVGAICGVRSTLAKTGKGHVEYTVDGFHATGQLLGGVIDAVTDIGPTETNITPGNGSCGGACCILTVAGTTASLRRNGTSTAIGLPGGTAPAIGDKIIVEFDTTVPNISFYYYRNGGATTLLATYTLTSLIPAAWHGHSGGNRTGDQITGNFGASAFSMTPTAGYAGW